MDVNLIAKPCLSASSRSRGFWGCKLNREAPSSLVRTCDVPEDGGFVYVMRDVGGGGDGGELAGEGEEDGYGCGGEEKILGRSGDRGNVSVVVERVRIVRTLTNRQLPYCKRRKWATYFGWSLHIGHVPYSGRLIARSRYDQTSMTPGKSRCSSNTRRMSFSAMSDPRDSKLSICSRLTIHTLICLSSAPVASISMPSELKHKLWIYGSPAFPADSSVRTLRLGDDSAKIEECEHVRCAWSCYILRRNLEHTPPVR